MKSGKLRALVRNAAYGFGALVLAGGWFYFYVQSRAVDLAAAAEAFGILGELRALDRSWNDRVLQARNGTVQPPTGMPVSAASLHARLRVQVFRFTSRVPGRELTELERAFEQKATLIELYTRPGQPRTAADGLFERVWFSPVGPRLDLVASSLQNALAEAVDENELYRVFLLYYSGFLVMVLGSLVWGLASSRLQIDSINQQLRNANESLESRVLERTRELSEALAKLKESEAMLIQSEKMSSLGQMVAGIAHEVNTPLAYVKASLEAVRAHVERDSRLMTETDSLLGMLAAENADPSGLEAQFSTVRGMIEELRSRRAGEEIGKTLDDGLYGIGQISEIVANLKDFSRLDRSKVADYDLRAGLESTLRIAHNVLKNREVRKEFASIPHVSCSPSQINQVFLNLISNASQATSDKNGIITLSTGAMSGSNEVWVDVTDNGHGIAPEVLPKIFDPFFTTKEVGKGTGLGLSICYKIVQSHGGRIEVDSKVGEGTRFRVILPAVRAQAVVA